MKMMLYKAEDTYIPALNMSSLTALKLLFEFRTRIFPLSEGKLQYLKTNNPAWLHLDWQGAESWSALLQTNVDLVKICRDACLLFIMSNPIFTKLASYGRDRLISSLNSDEIQVFRNGALLDTNPSDDVVKWWDYIKTQGKLTLNENLLLQGRDAERWTLEIEKEIVKNLGISYEPKWVAIDGDHYGYDILSYRLIDGEIQNILIEVKSFLNLTNPHFYLTNNEWRKAMESPLNYFFYIWSICEQTYKISTAKDFESDIPINNGAGEWQNVLIKAKWTEKCLT